MCTAPPPPEGAASRQFFADLFAPVLQFEQGKHSGRLVAIAASDDSNTGGFAARIELDMNVLGLAANTIP
jgi:hypothetical protein